MSEWVRTIVSTEPAVRDRSLESLCRGASTEDLLAGCAALELFDVAEALRDGDRADGFFASVFASVAPMSILFS